MSDNNILLEAGMEYASHIRVNQDRKMNCHKDFVAGIRWMWNIIHSPIDNQINKFDMFLKEIEGMYRE